MNREKFEAWFKSDFHPDKTGPYLKETLFFAWQAACKASEQQLAAVVAECACCKQDIEEIAEAMETGTDRDLFLAIDGAMNIETPATDSVLKRIQAQGVEMYAVTLDRGADDAERDGFEDGMKFLRAEAESVREFAAQLRQGAEHE